MPHLSPRNAQIVRRGFMLVVLAVVVPLAWLGPLDGVAKEQIEAGLKRALVTFAAARAANAVISVVQETQVAVSPMGVGVYTSPGQILDPLNDLIEQFSTIMLAASVSLGAQVVLINIGGLAAVSAALTLALAAWAFMRWTARDEPRWLARVVVVLLFVRFAVPLAALGSEGAFRVAMSAEYAHAQRQLDATAKLIENVPEAEAAEPKGLLERGERWLADRSRALRANMTVLKARAEELVRHVITLMAVFIVQTAILPIAFLWLAYRVFGATLRWPWVRPGGG